MAMTVKARMAIERRVIRRVITDALGDPEIELSVDDEPRTRNAAKLLSDVTAVDEARLYFHARGIERAHGWVFFVLGNDGWDVICDYTVNLEPLLAGAEALADEIERDHS